MRLKSHVLRLCFLFTGQSLHFSLKMAQPALYRSDIPSLRDLYPQLPIQIGTVALNRAIQQEAPVQRVDLAHAEAVANCLEAIEAAGNHAQVTPHIVTAARARANAVAAAQSTAIFGAQDIADALRDLRDEIRQTNVANQNLRILSYNNRLQPPNLLRPLKKTSLGCGRALATGLAPAGFFNNVNNQVQFDQRCPAAPIPAVGATPPAAVFHPRIENYQHIDILVLIAYYNDDFGIVVGDSVPDRQVKIRDFFSQFYFEAQMKKSKGRGRRSGSSFDVFRMKYEMDKEEEGDKGEGSSAKRKKGDVVRNEDEVDEEEVVQKPKKKRRVLDEVEVKDLIVVSKPVSRVKPKSKAKKAAAE
ncbi:unnamed protein product [Cyclocybe aegerita]|uniref:Uncharacterized protein n=1 Tax=Cyclocybe aegerita TaxID=1973307 RepID=A0A8S0W0K8_CYCAE|nr:unnamed protein product [Cyclocybe aegerita]